MLILLVYFKEIGEDADGLEAAVQRARLKQAADRIGGVAMLGDQRFERRAAAERGGVFGAQRIEAQLGFRFARTALRERGARVGDLAVNLGDALRGGIELDGDLAAASAAALQ